MHHLTHPLTPLYPQSTPHYTPPSNLLYPPLTPSTPSRLLGHPPVTSTSQTTIWIGRVTCRRKSPSWGATIDDTISGSGVIVVVEGGVGQGGVLVEEGVVVWVWGLVV